MTEVEDIYVDGGFLCNYPIHAFDGKFCRKPFKFTTQKMKFSIKDFLFFIDFRRNRT